MQVLIENQWLHVLLVSAMPFSELRGGIPLGIYYGFDPVKAFLIAVIGNLIPIPFLLLFLERLRNFASRWWLTAKLYKMVERRTERKRKLIDKYGYLGLTMFVAVPLPVTGAWTGSLLAFLLKLNPLKAFVFIAMGVIIAGIVVLSTTLGVSFVLNS